MPVHVAVHEGLLVGHVHLLGGVRSPELHALAVFAEEGHRVRQHVIQLRQRLAGKTAYPIRPLGLDAFEDGPVFKQGEVALAGIGYVFGLNQKFHIPTFGHVLQISRHGSGNSLINRIKETQQNSAMVGLLPKPLVDPALYSFRQGFGMVSGNNNQVGHGRFVRGNGSQLRYVELTKEPNLFCNLAAPAKISG